MKQLLTTKELEKKCTLIHGDPDTVAQLLISTAVKLQKESKVIFIDTNHTFTPQFIHSRYTKQLPAVDRIFINRPNSKKELQEFIHRLPELLKKSKIKILIIPSINHLFRDDDNKTIQTEFKKIIQTIKAITTTYHLITVLGNTSFPHDSNVEINRILCEEMNSIYGV